MKEKYYYIRDEENKPRVTVCLMKEEEGDVGITSRGVSVCSYQDNPCKRVGRKIARNRANYALLTGEDSLPILTNHSGVAMNVPFVSKSEFMPFLSEMEDRILNPKRGKKSAQTQDST